jgi:hypothetical protein
MDSRQQQTADNRTDSRQQLETMRRHEARSALLVGIVSVDRLYTLRCEIGNSLCMTPYIFGLLRVVKTCIFRG